MLKITVESSNKGLKMNFKTLAIIFFCVSEVFSDSIGQNRLGNNIHLYRRKKFVDGILPTYTEASAKLKLMRWTLEHMAHGTGKHLFLAMKNQITQEIKNRRQGMKNKRFKSFQQRHLQSP